MRDERMRRQAQRPDDRVPPEERRNGRARVRGSSRSRLDAQHQRAGIRPWVDGCSTVILMDRSASRRSQPLKGRMKRQ
jgi:hypothetical protein